MEAHPWAGLQERQMLELLEHSPCLEEDLCVEAQLEEDLWKADHGLELKVEALLLIGEDPETEIWLRAVESHFVPPQRFSQIALTSQ